MMMWVRVSGGCKRRKDILCLRLCGDNSCLDVVSLAVGQGSEDLPSSGVLFGLLPATGRGQQRGTERRRRLALCPSPRAAAHYFAR